MTNNIFGFDVYIEYVDNNLNNYGNIDVKNITQVHFNYDKHIYVGDKRRIAFESDIHSTGFTREIRTINKVLITLSTKKYNNIHNK
jgi:predicted MPP superfamily phosphohydrolase